MAPWADILYACDLGWWQKYHSEPFDGERWTQDVKAACEFGLNYAPSENKPGLGKSKIHQGGNSGYQAINLAYLMGAEKIYLLGYDMQKTGGKSHWHGDHPRGLTANQPVWDWVKRFPALASDLHNEGVQVINLTRETALACFEKGDIECIR